MIGPSLLHRAIRMRLCLLRDQQSGTALAEYSLVLPMMVLFLALSIQLALIVIQYYSTMHITRETTRWLSINPDTFDSAVVTKANSLRPNLPGVNNAAFTTVAVSPSCTALVNNHCPSRDPGASLSVTITANVSSVLIFPSTFNVFNWSFSFPTSLPAYRVTAMVE
ncbi:MAG: TadE/TadG family type IV pilus assembly protein [Chloroflexota bacterium]